MNRAFIFSLLFMVLPLAGACGADSAGEVATGQYRNLFVEDGHSPQETQAKVNAAFEQLFHGDPNSNAVYFPAGTNANGPLAYVADIGDGDVRSEGMSYGMMITVELDKKAEFDALWNWAMTYMYHDSTNNPACGYFSWSMNTNGAPNDEMPAPDGEQYFATSLYFAAHRWGNGPGIYNYQAQADRLLTDFIHRGIITGLTVTGVQTGEAIFDSENKMVRFTSTVPAPTDPSFKSPALRGANHTDPSYQLPAFYELWALWGPAADRPFWKAAAAASRDFFEHAANPRTALTPDYANFDGTPWATPWNTGSADFQWDAWRTAMNWSVDWAWWASDAREPPRSDRLQMFFKHVGFDTYGNRFTLEGQQLEDTHSTGLVAMNAVASLAATRPRAKYFVEALWEAPIPSGQWRYYDGMLYMLAMLHCSGEFRVWAPSPPQGSHPDGVQLNK